jgi:hypothetical protein
MSVLKDMQVILQGFKVCEAVSFEGNLSLSQMTTYPLLFIFFTFESASKRREEPLIV